MCVRNVNVCVRVSVSLCVCVCVCVCVCEVRVCVRRYSHRGAPACTLHPRTRTHANTNTNTNTQIYARAHTHTRRALPFAHARSRTREDAMGNRSNTAYIPTSLQPRGLRKARAPLYVGDSTKRERESSKNISKILASPSWLPPVTHTPQSSSRICGLCSALTVRFQRATSSGSPGCFVGVVCVPCAVSERGRSCFVSVEPCTVCGRVSEWPPLCRYVCADLSGNCFRPEQSAWEEWFAVRVPCSRVSERSALHRYATDLRPDSDKCSCSKGRPWLRCAHVRDWQGVGSVPHDSFAAEGPRRLGYAAITGCRTAPLYSTYSCAVLHGLLQLLPRQCDALPILQLHVNLLEGEAVAVWHSCSSACTERAGVSDGYWNL